MSPTSNLATAIATDTVGAIDLMVADTTFDKTAQELMFLADYKAFLQAASGRSNGDQDAKFNMIFSRWFIKNSG